MQFTTQPGTDEIAQCPPGRPSAVMELHQDVFR
jgi:hypothetical protein